MTLIETPKMPTTKSGSAGLYIGLLIVAIITAGFILHKRTTDIEQHKK